jgi:hypothetical protein
MVSQDILVDHLPAHWPKATFGMSDEGNPRAIDSIRVFVVNRPYIVVVGGKGTYAVKDRPSTTLGTSAAKLGACGVIKVTNLLGNKGESPLF